MTEDRARKLPKSSVSYSKLSKATEVGSNSSSVTEQVATTLVVLDCNGNVTIN